MRYPKITSLLLSLLLTSVSTTAWSEPDIHPVPQPDDVISIIHRVNDAWQEQHPPETRAFWDEAAYHTGNMAAYAATGNTDYRDYSAAWAEHNQWKGAKSNNPTEWKHHYGESDDFVLFGDWQICFQTYIDLFELEGSVDVSKIARAREVMEYQMGTEQSAYWWWADGLYMVMPVMTKLHRITGNPLYLSKLHEYFQYADDLMFDADSALYFRDAKYVYPAHKTAHGMKDFWARGNGWVFAGFAKVLQDLDPGSEHAVPFLDRFLRMAIALAASQQPDGYWTRSLLDAAHAPGPETSGTAFFTYGLLWGINQGILDRDTYLPVAMRAWNYLIHTALQPNGSIGYVQPIGERAIPGQVVNQHSTTGFGVGAFLLAATEMLKLATAEEQ